MQELSRREFLQSATATVTTVVVPVACVLAEDDPFIAFQREALLVLKDKLTYAIKTERG
ncbi:MAG: hypothetical protein GY927_11495 [bacterium]|nr:hypothetical protein [bacterium]